MRQLLRKLRYVPKSSGITAALAITLMVPAVLLAYGPSRQGYTADKPPTHVTLNSITNSPNYGNEFNFVNIKDAASTTSGGWQDTITVQPGREYLVRIYVDNNAAASRNLVATNTRVKANVPSTTGTSATINGFVSASNSTPPQVWDQVILKSSSPFKASYVPGTARLFNNAYKGGTKLPDSVATSSGALIGYRLVNDQFDGKLPGGFQYTATITFRVRVLGTSQTPTPTPAPSAPDSAPGFTVQKTVRPNGGDTTYLESASVKPGDRVDFRIAFKNTGDTQLKNVAVKDVLPMGLRYVPGTTKLNNSSGSRTIADGVTSTGIVIGGYMPDGNAYVTFTAEVAANASLPRCGSNTLTNTATISTASGSKSDTATVLVARTCVTPGASTTDYQCKQLSAADTSRNTYQFITTATKTETVYPTQVKIAYGDGTSEVVPFGTSPSHTYTAPGSYTAIVHLTYSVNGRTVTDVTHPLCKVRVIIPEAVASTSRTATQTTSRTTTSTPTTYTTTVAETETETPVHTRSTTVHEEPGEVRSVTTTRTETPTTYTTTTTPTTTKYVPSTGPETLLSGLLGTSALGLGTHSWLSSRRAIRAAARR